MKNRRILAWIITLTMVVSMFTGMASIAYAGDGGNDKTTNVELSNDEDIEGADGNQDALDNAVSQDAIDKTAIGEKTSPEAVKTEAETSESADKLSADEKVEAVDQVEKEMTLGAEANSEGLSELVIHTGAGEEKVTSTAILGPKSIESYNNGMILFNQETKAYTFEASDDRVGNQLRFAAVPAEAGATVKVFYDGESKEIFTMTDLSTGYMGENWTRPITKAGKNVFSLVVTPPEGSKNKSVTYNFTMYCAPSLSGLSVKDGLTKLYLNETFVKTTTDYTVKAANSKKSLKVKASVPYTGYVVTYNGKTSNDVDISDTNEINMVVSVGEGGEKRTAAYKLTVNKVADYDAEIIAAPADAIISVYDNKGVALSGKTGKFSNLLPGNDYFYAITRYGYVSQTGGFSDTSGLTDGKINISLEKAKKPEMALPNYKGDWTNFRGNEENMGITSAKIAKTSAEANLKWNVKYGKGWSESPTPPIIVNGNLYFACGKNVYKVNKETGAQIAKSENLVAAVGFALNPITYGEGMLFVPVGDGQVQALRADTLESVWVSEKIGRGQTLCPITYHNGYIYEGTWNRETEDGVYFGISVTDEDPSKTNETKYCSWKKTHLGGFYWAGAYATDKYVIFGSDDGTSEGDYSANAALYSVNPSTGEIIDTINGISGDIRSTIAYDKKTDAVYCTTKGGKFIKVHVNEDGSFDDNTYKTLELGGMSTGTPLVYDGIAFLGASGNSQFSGKGHSYKIVDATTMEIINTIDTIPGYVQTSALLSKAYANESENKVYIYITYNYTPGGVYVVEYDMYAKTLSGSHIFEPTGSLSQYCICSLVCDSDGTIYYKNDSGNMMAVENTTVKAEKIAAAKENLGNAISAAAISKAAVTISTSAAIVIEGKYFVAQEVVDSLTEAITGAQIVLNSESSTKTDYESALALLQTALNTFEAAKTPGTLSSGKGGNSSGSGGGAGVTPSPISKTDEKATTIETKTNEITGKTEKVAISETKVAAKTDSLGKASATVNINEIEKAVASAIKNAAEEEKKTGKNVSSEVNIKVQADKGTKSLEINIPTSSVKDAAKNENTSLKMSTPLADITFDKKALSIISDNAAAGKNITVTVEKVDIDSILRNTADNASKTEKIKEMIGGRPVFEISVKSDGNKTISNFGRGTVTASIPYALSNGEKADGAVVCYIADDGTITVMDSKYDAKTGTINFTTNHFSYYAVGYDKTKVTAKASEFKDVSSSDWFSDNVTYLVGKGIVAGKEENRFAPFDNITRAEFAAILARMSGDQTATEKSVFADVPDDSWYSQYVGWTVKTGIAKGTTANQFSPMDKITRQDMAVMIKRYADYKKTSLNKENAQIAFTDKDRIADYAKNSVSEMQMAGIINGISNKDSGYSFAPGNNATRAEAVTMIANYIK